MSPPCRPARSARRKGRALSQNPQSGRRTPSVRLRPVKRLKRPPAYPADGTGSTGGTGGGRKARRPKRTGWRRLIPTWRMTLLGFVTAVLLGIGLFALGITLVKVPDAHAAATAQSNTWLYQDGSVIARTGQTNRQNVPLDKVSPPPSTPRWPPRTAISTTRAPST